MVVVFATPPLQLQMAMLWKLWILPIPGRSSIGTGYTTLNASFSREKAEGIPNIFECWQRNVKPTRCQAPRVVNSYRDVYRRSMRYVQFSHSTAYS